MAKESRRQSAMGYDDSNTGNKRSSVVKQIKHEQIKRGKSLEEIEALEAKEFKKKAHAGWEEKYNNASPTEQEIMKINRSINLENLNISDWKQKKVRAENLYLDQVADGYLTKINNAKSKIKKWEEKKNNLQAQLNKEQPNRQASMESLTSNASQQSQKTNLPQHHTNPLHREISDLRIEESAETKKLSEINKEISKAKPLVTAIITDHAKLKQLSEKIKATSKWSGLRNLWRRIIDKDSKDEKIDKYEKIEKQIKENIEDKKSQLTEMTPKLKELKVERSTVLASLAKIRANIAANQAQQREISNKIQKRRSQESLSRR